MSEYIKLRKGFDIRIKGKAEEHIEEGVQSETYAIKPTDFISFEKPKVLVKEGDTVKAGTPLYFDKSREEIKYCSPVSGEVVAVKRGDKRKLLEIVVLGDAEIQYEQHPSFSISDIQNKSAEDIKAHIAASGAWPNLVQRPFAVVANPTDTPKAIFISAFDTHPIAPQPSFLIQGKEDDFKMGVEVLKRLTSGKVHLNISATAEIARTFTEISGIEVNKFSGPHPAGNVGVQIHHLDPMNKGEIAWTISPVGVAQIGKLFAEGKYDASKLLAVAGSEIEKPQYYKTYTGANIKNFLANNVKSDNVRVISGNVLTGEKIEEDGHIGFYDNMVTVIPEGDYLRWFGSFVPSRDRLSFGRSIGLLSFLNKFLDPTKEYDVDTNINGEHRAFVVSGVLEKVLPMDILPVHLMKAIMAEDFDEMEALGIYEVAEEDLALCEYVDVSKHNVQEIIRKGIQMIQSS